jgi:Mn-dependent DtxR family transcriptional regulator
MLGLQELSPKQQAYVETIDELANDNGAARISDVADKLHVSPPSVSEAVGRLVKQGLAVRKSWHEIELSGRGRAIAATLTGRHRALLRFMTDVLGMNPEDADKDACRVEHCISREFGARLTCFGDFASESLSPEFKTSWRRYMQKNGNRPSSWSQRRTRTGKDKI